MMSHNHALSGVAVYVALPILGVPAPLAAAGWAAGAAMFPDIDHPSSTVSKFLGPVARGFRWVTRAKHRGLTHTWAFLGLVLVAVALWRPLLLIPIGVGYACHIVGDWVFDGRAKLHPKTAGWLEKKVLRPLMWAWLPAAVFVAHVAHWRIAW